MFDLRYVASGFGWGKGLSDLLLPVYGLFNVIYCLILALRRCTCAKHATIRPVSVLRKSGRQGVSGNLQHGITEIAVYLNVSQWIAGKESDMVERPKFFQAHDRLQEQTLALYTQESWDHLMGYSAWWNALIHYLIDEYSEQQYPLMEAPTTTDATLWLASCGYYRQATALLRDLLDLVLWSWKIRHNENAGRVLKDGKKHYWGIRDKDIPSIIDGPMVARYRTFVGNNIPEIFHQKLISPVNPERIQSFRHELHGHVHAKPDHWNIESYANHVPIAQFNAQQWRKWEKSYVTVQFWCATWSLLMFPGLMRWSQDTPLEAVYEMPQDHHDIWWLPALPDETMYFFHEWLNHNFFE